MTDEVYQIRPAGRHILTIGRDLIQDQHAALVELVKNAYDADSTFVEISFKKKQQQKKQCVGKHKINAHFTLIQ